MWENKVILAADEKLRRQSSKTSGFMAEEDIEIYSIVREDGTKTGTVQVSDHTAVKGFRRTISVRQTDINGKTVVQESFTLPR